MHTERTFTEHIFASKIYLDSISGGKGGGSYLSLSPCPSDSVYALQLSTRQSSARQMSSKFVKILVFNKLVEITTGCHFIGCH